MNSLVPDGLHAAQADGLVSSDPNEQPDAAASQPGLFHKGILVIKNEGSTTRDYLAFERNFLAWVKLVVYCMVISGGLLIRLHVAEDVIGPKPDFSLENRFAVPGGIIFFIVAIMSLVAATLSFFRAQRDMVRGVGHLTNGRLIQWLTIIIGATIAASCVVMVISSSQARA